MRFGLLSLSWPRWVVAVPGNTVCSRGQLLCLELILIWKIPIGSMFLWVFASWCNINFSIPFFFQFAQFVCALLSSNFLYPNFLCSWCETPPLLSYVSICVPRFKIFCRAFCIAVWTVSVRSSSFLQVMLLANNNNTSGLAISSSVCDI